MSAVQEFRANAFIYTVLRPQLDSLRDEQPEDGDLIAYSLDAVRRLVLRQSGDEPTGYIDPTSAVNLLLLLNELELFNFGVRVGYFDAATSGELGIFRRDLKSYAASLDESWAGYSDQFDELLKIVEKDYTWDFVDEIEMSGYDLFIDRYARNRNLHYAEVKDTLAVLLFSTVEEWGDEIDPLRILANTLIEDPALHLSDSEVDSLSWALSGTDLLLDAEEEFGFTSPFPNLVEKVILDTRGYAFTRRVELAAVRQQIFDSTSRLDTDEIATKLRVLQRNVGESARDLPRLVQSSKQELRKAIEEKPRRELDE